MKNEKITKIISIILSLILSALFTVFSYMFCIYFSFFNISSIEKCMFSSGYYMEAYEQFCTDVEDIVIPTGFPYETFSNITDAAYMKNAIIRYVHNVIKVNIKGTNVADIENAVKENAAEYLRGEGIEITREYDTVINELAAYICNSYKEKILNKWFLYLGYMRNSFLKNIKISVIPISVITLLSATVLFLIQKWKHRTFRYLAYSSTAAAVLTVAGPTVLYFSEIYKKLYFQPKYFYDFAMIFIENGLKNMYFIAAGWALFSMACLLYIKFTKNRLHKLHRI